MPATQRGDLAEADQSAAMRSDRPDHTSVDISVDPAPDAARRRSLTSSSQSFMLRRFTSFRSAGFAAAALEMRHSRCAPAEEWYDKNPRLGTLLSTIVYVVPIAAALLVLMVTEATISSKGHLLLASFSAIRDTTTALGAIFSFFWFFEMAATGKLHGQNDWNAIGAHMFISTLASFACGIFAMLVLVLLADPLVDIVSPAKDADAIKGIALDATKIAAVSIPFAVYNFAGAGLLLGTKRIAKTVGVFFFWGVLTAVAILYALFKLDCSDEELEFCPDTIREDLTQGLIEIETTECVQTYELHGWVCSDYEKFLASSAGILSAGSAGVAVSFLFLQWRLIRPHKVNFLAAVRSSSFLREWSRDTAWVAVRSVINNSRHLVAIAVALRMGITASAAFIMFGSVSNMAGAVPSSLANVAMITVSRLIGKGEHVAARHVLNDYRIFGLVCGLAFCVIAVVARDGLINQYSKETEEAALRAVMVPVWGWVIAYQPLRALLGVYNALIAGNQEFSYWGKATVAATLSVFLPTTVLAAHTARVDILIIGEVLFTGLLAALLYIKVHWFSSLHKHNVNGDESGRDASASGSELDLEVSTLDVSDAKSDPGADPNGKRGAFKLKGGSSGKLEVAGKLNLRGTCLVADTIFGASRPAGHFRCYSAPERDYVRLLDNLKVSPVHPWPGSSVLKSPVAPEDELGSPSVCGPSLEAPHLAINLVREPARGDPAAGVCSPAAAAMYHAARPPRDGAGPLLAGAVDRGGGAAGEYEAGLPVGVPLGAGGSIRGWGAPDGGREGSHPRGVGELAGGGRGEGCAVRGGAEDEVEEAVAAVLEEEAAESVGHA